MQTSLTATSGLERRLEVAVPAQQVSGEIEQRLQRLSRTARLKGFRPGKVPLAVVRQQFGDQVKAEVIGDLMRSSFAEAVRQEKLKPAADPRIEPIAMDGDLKYAAIFEVLPEIEVAGDALKVERPAATVSEPDVDAMIDSMRRQLAARNAAAAASAAGGAESGEAPDAAAAPEAPAEGAAPVAAAPGQEPVPAAELPPVDEEFCRAFGVEEGGPEVLRAEVRKSMERELSDVIRGRVKSQVMEELLRANPIDVPRALVDEQIRNLQLDMARRIGARDISQLPPREQFEETARKRVALGLLISEILRAQSLKLDRDRVQSQVDELASAYPNPDEVRRAYLQSPEAMRQIEAAVLEDQAIDWLLERASVTERQSTFKELTGFGLPAPESST